MITILFASWSVMLWRRWVSLSLIHRWQAKAISLLSHWEEKKVQEMRALTKPTTKALKDEESKE